MRWRVVLRRLFGGHTDPPQVGDPPPAQREHIPELHALKQRRTVQTAKLDLANEELRRLRADTVVEQRMWSPDDAR